LATCEAKGRAIRREETKEKLNSLGGTKTPAAGKKKKGACQNLGGGKDNGMEKGREQGRNTSREKTV